MDHYLLRCWGRGRGSPPKAQHKNETTAELERQKEATPNANQNGIKRNYRQTDVRNASAEVGG